MAERKPIISFRNFSFQYRAQKRPTLTKYIFILNMPFLTLFLLLYS